MCSQLVVTPELMILPSIEGMGAKGWAAFHQSGFSLKWLFIETAFHQSGFSLKRLFIEAAFH
jgi:hypothetical protein